MTAVRLRVMAAEDLPLIEGWLGEPHIARWWLSESTAAKEIRKYRRRIAGHGLTTMLTLLVDDRPVGWAQQYSWDNYPTAAGAVGAEPGEVGLDYAIGDPDEVGHGLGTTMIAALVGLTLEVHGDVGIVVAPEAGNHASRRVLEKNRFELIGIGPVESEPHNRPMAIYRLEAKKLSSGSGRQRR